MPGPLGVVKTNAPYVYGIIGVIWLALAFTAGSALLLWPVAACLLGGVLLKVMPGKRLSWAWGTAAGVMGLVLALYQAFVASSAVTGSLSTIAGASLVAFVVFAAAHLLLIYGTNAKSK